MKKTVSILLSVFIAFTLVSCAGPGLKYDQTKPVTDPAIPQGSGTYQSPIQVQED